MRNVHQPECNMRPVTNTEINAKHTHPRRLQIHTHAKHTHTKHTHANVNVENPSKEKGKIDIF